MHRETAALSMDIATASFRLGAPALRFPPGSGACVFPMRRAPKRRDRGLNQEIGVRHISIGAASFGTIALGGRSGRDSFQ